MGHHSGMDDDTPPGAASVPRQVLGWWASIMREVAYAPATLGRVRKLLDEVVHLPGHLERVVGAVEGTTTGLGGSLEDVAGALAEIRDRLEHLDTVIWHLRDTLVALIAAVPGTGRVLDRLPPPPAPVVAPGGRGGLRPPSGGRSEPGS